MKILVLFAHPRLSASHVQRVLADVVRDLEDITFHDLYAAYPDFTIDVAHEQALLLEHDLIVLQHPFYWYSAPAIIKEWLDLVLELGWAYGPGGNKLSGKFLMNALSTGGVEAAYRRHGRNRFEIAELLSPYQPDGASVRHGLSRTLHRLRRTLADGRGSEPQGQRLSGPHRACAMATSTR